ncbi:MAG: FRG domain-containing protein [Bacteroidales bacterium]|nr:FRG domain-containing protein [Bacteroidales bacterium]
MEEEINSISNLIDILKKNNSDFEEDIWYRGQSNFDWTLSPGLMRLTNAPSEGSLLTRFKQSAGMLVKANPKDDFDWLFLMQHYGVPTRLLDWSESPLVALYFAVNNEGDDSVDAALWSLKPTRLNKIASISTNEKNFIPSFDDIELENYTVETLSSNPRNKLTPIATIATRNSSRIQAQLGVFTIHHQDNRAIEEICLNREVVKYKIPAKLKNEIRQELALLSVNKFSLFPELSSIGSMLKEKLL